MRTACSSSRWRGVSTRHPPPGTRHPTPPPPGTKLRLRAVMIFYFVRCLGSDIEDKSNSSEVYDDNQKKTMMIIVVRDQQDDKFINKYNNFFCLYIFTEEDKIDDGIEAVPSIRNLKSRFETKDAGPPPLPGDQSTRNR